MQTSHLFANKKIIFLLFFLLLGAVAWGSVSSEKLPDLRAQAEVKEADIPVLLHQGWEDYEQGRVSKALSKFTKVLSLDEGNIEALYGVGLIYKDDHNYLQAEKKFLQALKVMPGSADIMVELGMVYEAQGRVKEAAARYREALRYVPNLQEAGEGLTRLSSLPR